ncbi:MAG: M20/M25/M40 family metallo-hydrolase [Candidatus Bathyarchaeia archaeon]
MGSAALDIEDAVERRREEIVDFAMELIKIPTVNQPPDGNEAPGQHFLAKCFKKLGFEIDMFDCIDIKGIESHPLYWPGRNLKNRPNLVATWHGSGGGRSILFTSHMDVCPPVPLPWDKGDPFNPLIENGKMYGRGAGDMKGGMAAAFMAIKILHELEFSPCGDVMFESVVDEEFAGANGTLACRLRGYKADLCINPEPTNMVICPATLGAKLIRITIHGTAGMPYTGQSLYNPVSALGKVIDILYEFERFWNKKIEEDSKFCKLDFPLNVIVWQVKAGELPPHEQMGIPKDAWLSAIIQTPPRVSEEEFDEIFYDFLHRRIKNDPELLEHRLIIEKTHRYMHPADFDFDHPAIKFVEKICQDTLKVPLRIGVAPFSCDLFLFQHLNAGPAICLGPKSENLHASNECVYIEDIITLTKIFAKLIAEWTCRRPF